MMKKFVAILGLIVLGFSLVACCTGVCEPKAPLATTFALHKNYGSHAVLQRQKPIRISGTATAGHAVKVTLGSDIRYAVANAQGEWEVSMPAREATKEGESLTLVVSGAEGKSITCTDILIGEVWFCSGQSNMGFPMWSERKWCHDNNGAEVIAQAPKYVNKVRFFDASVIKYVSPKGYKTEPRGEWVVPTDKDIARFSAVAYYFGRELNENLNVPVGLISAAWGGTGINTWISADGFRNAYKKTSDELFGQYVKMIDDILAGVYDTEKELKLYERQVAWGERFMSYNPEAAKAAEPWKTVDYDDSSWEKLKSNALKIKQDGVCRAWLRYTIDIPQAMAGKELKLYLGAIDDADVTYFNGVKVGCTDIRDEEYWIKQRIYTIPAELAKVGKAVIAIQFINYASAGQVNPGKEGLTLTDGTTKLALTGDWRFKVESIVDIGAIGERPGDSETVMNSPQTPATLFNSMIYPWTRYTIRGVIWYQGCHNYNIPDEYAKLFAVFREDWMKHWNEPNLPIITTQVSAFRHPGGPQWARFREMQFEEAHKYDNVGIALSLDCEKSDEIHPLEKAPVGHRLCAEAMRMCYGYKGITSGPVYKSCQTVDNKLVVKFDFAGQGIIASNGKQPAGFEVAGADGKYVNATAVITGKDEITLSAPQIARPLSARYAWCATNGAPNIGNADGFPMVPFRTKK